MNLLWERGEALVLSYVVYNGSTWIMHSNRMNTGYEAYHMEKFEGADNLVAEMNFYEKNLLMKIMWRAKKKNIH